MKKLSMLLMSFSLCFPTTGSSQQASNSGASSTQAGTMLAQSAVGLTGNTTLSDVTLSGSAHWISGSTDENGTFTLTALAPGATRINLSLPSGQRNEIRNLSANSPAGTWAGPDGTSHLIAHHNVLAESVWIYPSLGISALLSNSQYQTTYVGQKTENGESLQHFSVHQILSSDPAAAPFFSHLTQVDVFLNSSTLLPSIVRFSTHPDTNAAIDIPVEILFSDYRAVNKAQVPFHIQKFLNGSLLLDLQASSAAINSGVSASTFSLQ